LVFGIYALPKIISRIQNNEVVKGDRLDNVVNTNLGDDKLTKIGPAPKFELVNQDNLKITNETYIGNICFRVFLHYLSFHLSKMNQSMLLIEKNFLAEIKFRGVSNMWFWNDGLKRTF
jgi:protein SCO1/2